MSNIELKQHTFGHNNISVFTVTPLTIDDKCTNHATLAVCYQLAQTVLKIGFVLAKEDGIVGSGLISA